MGGLESALAATEERVDAALKAAAAVTRELKKAKTGAERGQLRDLRRALSTAAVLAGDAARTAEDAGSSFGFDEQVHMESGSYAQELLDTAAAQDVAMFEADERLLCYPSLIKVLPGDAAVEIDRRREKRLRPSVLVGLLAATQARPPRFRPEPFLESLASGYDLAHLVYQEGRERPDNCGIYTADILSGAFAYGAIATALVQRHSTGLGQMIDVSMLEAMLNLTTSEVQVAQFPQPPAGKPLFSPVATADGYIMPAIASERTFQNLAKAAGREDWTTDPRFAQYPIRRANWGALIEELEHWSRQLTTVECEAALNRHGVPCSAYRSVAEAMADPQLAHREALAEVFDAGGSFRVVNAPYRLSAGVTKVREFSAGLGQHTSEILRAAGYSDPQIDALAAAGVINSG